MMRACPVYWICVALGLSGAAIGQERLLGFGLPNSGDRLPGFRGLSENAPKVIEKDRAYAQSRIAKVDTNKDGVMTREELRNSRDREYEERWFLFDANRNHHLTVDEFANYYAKSRVDKEAAKSKAEEAKQRALKDQLLVAKSQAAPQQAIHWTNSGVAVSNDLVLHIAGSRSQQKQLQRLQLAFIQQNNGRFVVIPPQGSVGAAQVVIGHYDKNGNGVLERNECQRIEGRINLADADGNGGVNLQELAAWLGKQDAGKPSSSPGNWFIERDANHDGQVSMLEYASEWTNSRLAEFNLYDQNQDGIITAAESVAAEMMHGREFASSSAVVIEPGAGVSSVIQVSQDFAIADIDVRLSILHTGPGQLAAFLVSPSGRRVELFTGVGKKWKGSNFDNTLFDDDAKTSISAAMPPFHGPLKPEGADSDEKPGLASYHGERSKGEWRLFIQADRSNRAGLLDSWSLVLVPQR